jgi:excisionase family DNA binding protein
MGSKYLTVDQAAAILGVTKRSIYRYVKRGLLKGEYDGHNTVVLEEDLKQIKKGRHDALSSPVKRDMVTALQVQVQTLQMQMATVMRILNVRYTPLDLTVPEYLSLYKSAEEMSTQGWSPQHEEIWSEYFVRITVEDMEGIETATGDKHPWRPFLRLVTTMHLSPYNRQLTEMFAAGRSNVQQVAGVWCVIKEESPRTFDILQERDAAPIKKLVRRLQRFQS